MPDPDDQLQNPHVGSSFDDFLKEEGIHDEVVLTMEQKEALISHREEQRKQLEQMIDSLRRNVDKSGMDLS